MSDQPQRISSDSVICPYCDEGLGVYPDDFYVGNKYSQTNGNLSGEPILFVCDRCNKSFRISVRKTISIITTGMEGD